MSKLGNLNPERVFKYFEQICAIPRGSENMDAIASYCVAFAEAHSLRAVRDGANNVIIYKDGTAGYESSAPIILQGHLDIVCQKEDGYEIDFERDGLDVYAEGDYVKARGTTLGADNGIAVAMVLAVLESDDIPHPPIEAVFTTDEEIGMIGAGALDMSLLRGKKMINLDAEEDDTVTVSCAGGSDFRMTVPIGRESGHGTEVTVTVGGLLGGHSGVEIDKGRVNANVLMGRFLSFMNGRADFGLISIDGGDKGNAIPRSCTVRLCVSDPATFIAEAEKHLSVIRAELSGREPGFTSTVKQGTEAEFRVIDRKITEGLIRLLLCVPNGVSEMSAEIKGLVETSSNLGVLKTDESEIILHFTLRSNKNSALAFLEERFRAVSACIPCKVEVFGHYPSWEYRGESALQKLCAQCYEEQYGFPPKLEAIHAGLECGVFASGIEGLDCIALGPQLYDVHTVSERLNIPSTERTYKLLLEILKRSK